MKKIFIPHLNKQPLENIEAKTFVNYRTGGPVDYLYHHETIEDSTKVIKFCLKNSIPITLIGDGSNILVSDTGIRGMVIVVKQSDSSIKIIDTNKISVTAGTLLNKTVFFANSNGFKGMESLAGIPGTVGGGLFMNAGAFDQNISDMFFYAEGIDLTNGNFLTFSKNEVTFSYRKSSFNDVLITSACFKFQMGSSESLLNRSKEIITRRNAKQPLDHPSCGSVFKRPQGSYAGLLIENCGLKGFRFGGAQLSEKHANFILNIDNATSFDIYTVIKKARQKVFESTGITLELEVKLLGDFTVQEIQ